MMIKNRITQLFNIEYPIIQAGMIWASGWKLASEVSKAGGLGLIGGGSMYPQMLEDHIQKCKKHCNGKPFGVNIPLVLPTVDAHMEVILREKVPIVFTSAGSPGTWTKTLKKEGIKVVHVVSSSKFAIKAEAAGCDAVVAEGFEAGGHNGREETTTFVLTPLVAKAVNIPVIAAGGIVDGRSMLAAMVLGAQGVQLGTRFVASFEASSHENFKQKVVNATEGETMLMMKQVTPVRLLRNKFSLEVGRAELAGASVEQMKELLGRKRAKRGMFEGDMEEGELEIGQVSAAIDELLPAGLIVQHIMREFFEAAAITNSIIQR
jgi:enoyl-[acyl-carrier protein] reductase II